MELGCSLLTLVHAQGSPFCLVAVVLCALQQCPSWLLHYAVPSSCPSLQSWQSPALAAQAGPNLGGPNSESCSTDSWRMLSGSHARLHLTRQVNIHQAYP